MKAWLFRRGGVLVVLASAFLCLMVLFAVTPIVWIWTGKGPYYPELFFALYGTPFGVLLLAASIVNGWFKRKRR